MKFTLRWLKDHLDTDASIEELLDTLTAVGLEVESVHNPNTELNGFQVVEVVSVSKHPEADKLSLCNVDNGSNLKQIICGATNVKKGLKTILASPGNVIPLNGNKIKVSKIRGFESHGMLCSASELKLSDNDEGIIELDDDCINGTPASEVLDLDILIDVSLTPNRVDALGVRGIARDLAATGIGTLKTGGASSVLSSYKSKFSVVNNLSEKNLALCPHFTGRVIKGICNSESPSWLKQRLESIGLRPVSALVDITQYITIDLGRPLHAFDISKLNSFIGPRLAQKDEKITALDGKDYILDQETLVIADKEGPQAIAGIIGAISSSCDEHSKEIFLESAYFSPNSIARTGRHLGILSDARYCFERGVDPDSALVGIETATKMILDICGGEASEIIVNGEAPNISFNMDFKFSQIERFSGVYIEKEKVVEILESLGFLVKHKSEETLDLTIPSWRRDIDGDQDIVEEVLRIYGYDKIPVLSLPSIASNKDTYSLKNERNTKIKKSLVSDGFSEVITWSFLSNVRANLFSRGQSLIKLQNPISSDLDTLRPSIIPNLLSSIQKNLIRGSSNIKFFEIGPVFNKPSVNQNLCIGAARVGDFSPRHWKKDYRVTDVYDVKLDALKILSLAGIPIKNIITKQYSDGKPLASSWYHPGQSGVLYLGKNILAEFGSIHPSILNDFEIEDNVFSFEIFIDHLPEIKNKSGTRKKFTLSQYQSVERDFAFIIDSDIGVEQILRKITSINKSLISSVELFDMYEGEKISKGKKSIAFSILLEPKDKTMNISEIEEISSKIIQTVEADFGAQLRNEKM